MIKIIEYSKNKVKTTTLNKTNFSASSKLWIDITNPADEELRDIVHKTNILVSDLKKCLDRSERPRLEEKDNYRLIIFKAITNESIIPFGVFITKDYIITIHRDQIGTLDDMHKDIIKLNSVGLIKNGLNNLVYNILGEVTRDYFRTLDNIEIDLNKLEERISNHLTGNINQRFAMIKRTLIYFRQALSANRDVLIALEKSRFAKDSEKDIIRVIETETMQLINEESIYHDILTGTRENYLTAININLNQTIKEIGVLAMVILVPTMIATLYGMNFIVLPLKDNPNGFWILILIMVITTGLMLTYFKIKKWV